MSQYEEIFLKAQTCVPSELTTGTHFQGTGISGGFDHPADCLSSYLLFGTPYKTWLTFEGVGVPAGATIDKAFIRFTASSNESGAFSLNIHSVINGNQNFDCGNQGTMTYGTEYAVWNIEPSWTTSFTYETSNIGCLIQEIIDAESWDSESFSNSLTLAFEGDTGYSRNVTSFDDATLHIYYNGSESGYGYGYGYFNCDEEYDCEDSDCGCDAPDCNASGVGEGNYFFQTISDTDDDGFYACNGFCTNDTILLGDYNVVSFLSTDTVSAQNVAGHGTRVWLRYRNVPIPDITAGERIQINRAFITFNAIASTTYQMDDGDVVMDITMECGTATSEIGCFPSGTGTHPAHFKRIAGSVPWTIDYDWSADPLPQVYHTPELACLLQERIDHEWAYQDTLTFIIITDEFETDFNARRQAYDKSDEDYSPVLTVYYDVIFDSSGGCVVGGAADVTDVINVAGVVVGGAADVAKVVTEIPSGGIVLSGSAEISASITEIPSGGLLAGGIADENFNDIIESTGGLIVSGSSIPFGAVTEFPSGGIVAGGLADIHKQYTFPVSGGLVGSGNTSILFVYNPDVSGGLTLSGEADENFNDVIESSGGCVLSGSAHVETGYVIIAAGGLEGSGVAYVRKRTTADASGLVVIDTQTTKLFTYEHETSGGIVVSGGAISDFNDSETSTGGLVGSGAAAFDYTANHTVTGSVEAGGQAQHHVSRTSTTPVEIIAGSNTTILFVYEHLVSGGLSVSGNAPVTSNDVFAVSGGLSLSGETTESFVYTIPVSGGLVAGGNAYIAKIGSKFSTGGIAVSGASVFDYSANHDVTGGLLAGSSAIYNVNVSGSATLTATSSATMSANMIFAGKATLTANCTATLKLNVKPKHLLQELTTFILNESSVTDIIEDRYFPIMLPQNVTLPAITYQRISTGPMYDLRSAVGAQTTRLQLDCWSYDLSECKEMARALRELLHGYSDTMQSVDIFSCLLVSEVHLHESPINDSDRWLYHIACDFEFLHDTSIPFHPA